MLYSRVLMHSRACDTQRKWNCLTNQTHTLVFSIRFSTDLREAYYLSFHPSLKIKSDLDLFSAISESAQEIIPWCFPESQLAFIWYSFDICETLLKWNYNNFPHSILHQRRVPDNNVFCLGIRQAEIFANCILKGSPFMAIFSLFHIGTTAQVSQSLPQPPRKPSVPCSTPRVPKFGVTLRPHELECHNIVTQ